MRHLVNAGDIQRGSEKGTEKDDFDETSDLCDFGYVLFAPPLLAQTRQPIADQPTKSDSATPAALPGERTNQTGGGDKQNPDRTSTNAANTSRAATASSMWSMTGAVST
jgi:hypothetical protein